MLSYLYTICMEAWQICLNYRLFKKDLVKEHTVTNLCFLTGSLYSLFQIYILALTVHGRNKTQSLNIFGILFGYLRKNYHALMGS